jgi:putative CocE/NonD family hydrolase
MSSKPEYEVVVHKNVMVPMRDGVRLACDVYRPARDGAFLAEPVPALLERTPYGKDHAERVELNGVWYAERGYATVIMDVRGRYRSEGRFGFLAQEAEDGFDTVEWVARQPWCDGKVGTMGLSYAGWTQLAAATQGPPHLAAMWVDEAGANAWTSTVRHNGAFEMRFLCWAFWQGAKSREAKADPVLEHALASVDVRDWLTRMPLKRGGSPLSLLPAYEAWALDIATRGDYDAFWHRPGLDIARHWARIPGCPIVLTTGWYDSYTRAMFENFLGLSGPRTVKAIVGPWTHGVKQLGQPFAGDVEFGAGAALAHNAERLRFFDATLRGAANGWHDDPPLRLFVMGGGSGRRAGSGRLDHGGRWRNAAAWPLPGTRFTDYYLQPGGVLAPERPTAASAASRFVFDPRTPVPTVGGNMSSLVGLMPRPRGAADIPVEERERDVIGIPGAFDQREDPRFLGSRPPWLPLASRPDVLVWQTPPLARDVEVVGPITVTLWVSSSAPDTDVTAKLVDVHPPTPDDPYGFAMNVTDSILRLRYRNGGAAELLTPHEVCECRFELYPTATRFGAGHRLRLDVSSSNYPRFDVNPNTGDALWSSGLVQAAINAIHHDAARPSRVTLPLVES